MADLNQLDTKKGAEEGRKLYLKHPVTKEPLMTDGSKGREPEQMYLLLHGLDSDNWARHNHSLTQRVLAAEKDDIQFDAVNARNIEGYVKITIGWLIQEDGKLPEYSEAAAKAFYSKYKWAREQADNFASNRANFI
jgi:hypothetical protein